MASDSGSFPVFVPNAELDKNILSCIGEKITHLILWRDWRKSVLVFIVLQAIVFDLTNESAISVIGVWGLFGLWITVGYRFYVRCLQCFNKTNIQGNPYQKYLDVDMNIAKEPSKQIIYLVSSKIFEFLIKLQSIFFVKNLWTSLRWMVILTGMYLLGEIIYISYIVHLGLVLLFTMPKICTWNLPLMKFLKLGNYNVTGKAIQLRSQSPTLEELDINSLKKSDSDIKQEYYAEGKNSTTFEMKEAIEEFERLGYSSMEEETE